MEFCGTTYIWHEEIMVELKLDISFVTTDMMIKCIYERWSKEKYSWWFVLPEKHCNFITSKAW